MKEFSCGDVVPGCTAKFRAPTEAELLTHIAAHAQSGHGLSSLPENLILAVKQNIKTVDHD